MKVRGRKRSFHVTDTVVTKDYVTIRLDDSKELAFWLSLTLTESDLRELLAKMELEKGKPA
jgi:hypothetical protein